MSVAATSLLVSGILLGASMLLFKVEENKGKRILFSGLRNILDSILERTTYRLSHLSVHFGGGTFRIVFHYLVHKALSAVLGSLKALEKAIFRLQMRNRQSAKSVRPKEDKTHLDVIAEHKEKNALTEEEKQKLKEKSILG